MARAALDRAPLIRKGRAWLYVAPRGRKVRFFSNETIAHLIADGEAVRVGNVVRKASVCFLVASMLWSCVMPASARPIAVSITKLSRMSAAERAALDNPHLQKPKRADTRALVATGAWKSEQSASRYAHAVVSEEARRADLLPDCGIAAENAAAAAQAVEKKR